jgi:hypothetical protein
VGTGTHMNRLRQTLIALLAVLCLAGLPACGEDDVKREANQAAEKAKKEGKAAAEKAKKKAEKAKKDVDGQ